MIVERPYEIAHLPTRLRADFSALLPLGATGSQEDRERNFLSRALAAFAVHKLSGCTLPEAADSIVDGGGDGGIDAVHFSATSNTLWLVQSKYIDTGRGEPELGDVSKFKNGLENLLQGEFAAFEKNARWVARLPQIQVYLKAPALRIRAVLVYSGVNRVSEDRLRIFEDLKRRCAPDDDFFAFLPYSLTSVHDWLTGADEGGGVEVVELEILSPGWIRTPHETIYGLVRLSDIVHLHQAHGHRLVSANIRRYKGATEVNERIVATLRAEPEMFLYLNNGLTAYCERLEINNLDRMNATRKRVTARGFSIVNGAQTVGSIGMTFGADPAGGSDGMVFLKLISLERCEDDAELARRITQSTNFQNQIGVRDFAALDEQQERIAVQLRLDGVEYHYKEGDDTPPPDDTNFTLEEATTALACLEQEKECDLCARVLANRASLWSLEPVYPDDVPYRSRYQRLFRADRSARTVWRAVQTRRAVIAQLQAEARASAGIRKAFFENARALVLNIVFLRLHTEQGESTQLTVGERTAVANAALLVAEALWSACEDKGFVSRSATGGGREQYEQTRHFRSVFSTQGDCKLLRAATLAKLAQRQNGPAQAANEPAAQRGDGSDA